MGEFKGTKGEWRVKIQPTSTGYVNILNKQKISIATCYGGFETTKPNAQLISCAPEMLEMLIKMNNNNDWQIEDYIEIENLIKKATELK